MLSLIGFIVAAYAIVRLAQIPFEHPRPGNERDAKLFWNVLWCLSVCGIALVGYFAYSLYQNAEAASLRDQPPQISRFTK